jgi:hypothetical protein
MSSHETSLCISQKYFATKLALALFLGENEHAEVRGSKLMLGSIHEKEEVCHKFTVTLHSEVS